MKKINYLNKSQKILLAAMTVPLTVSVLPMEQTVHASTEIPSLNVYDLNGSPKLEWATDILQENILQKIDFEDLNISTNEFSVSNDAYQGSKSLKIHRTFDNEGNSYGENPGNPGSSFFNFNQKFKFNNNDNLSVSLKAKNLSATDSTLIFQTIGMLVDKPPTYSSLTNGKKITFKENVIAGQNYFYVNDIQTFKELIKSRNYVALNQPAQDGNYDIGMVTGFDEITGKVTLHQGFLQNFSANTEIHYGLWTNPILFTERKIEGNDWNIYNYNKLVSNPWYNFDTRSVIFEVLSRTNGDFLIDDIVIGYATEIEVYRNGQSIYRGHLADFHDTTVRDNVKPNKIDKVNSTISNDFNINLIIEKPNDNGMKASYQIQSIAKNGTRSLLSEPKNIEVKTDVVKYKYNISKQLIDNPINEIGIKDNLSIPLKSINLETDYLHVQAIDTNGNISDTSSFKLNELIDMKDIYDKVKELETSNDYNDFIDFIDEIEQLYGDNLPQDLKDRLNELANYHGVNTSFLLLEEGDFRLSTAEINDFGDIKLTAKKQTLTTSFKDVFGVIDARGTQEGWNMTVSATPFTVETFDGFVGLPHQLPLGSLALNVPKNIEQVGNVHNSQLPTISLNELSIIDGENHSVKLLNAEQHKGMGEFKFSFGLDALSLTVDAVTAKIDEINYPDSNTPYISTVTWNLISGPSI